MKDQKDTETPDLIGNTAQVKQKKKGRPPIYANEFEAKHARAAAARERRAKEKAAGIKEVRRKIKPAAKNELPESDVIDLSAVGYSTRKDQNP